MDKNTGPVRRLDDLGRIVLPVDMRRQMGLEPGASVRLNITLDGSRIVISHLENACVFCGADDAIEYRGFHVCRSCIDDLARIPGSAADN